MLSQERQERFLQQVFSLWITPEIDRRRGQGVLPAGFSLSAAEIVMWPDGKPSEVRFNEEVRGSFVVGPTQEVMGELGKLIGIDDISQISEFRPRPDETDRRARNPLVP